MQSTSNEAKPSRWQTRIQCIRYFSWVRFLFELELFRFGFVWFDLFLSTIKPISFYPSTHSITHSSSTTYPPLPLPLPPTSMPWHFRLNSVTSNKLFRIYVEWKQNDTDTLTHTHTYAHRHTNKVSSIAIGRQRLHYILMQFSGFWYGVCFLGFVLIVLRNAHVITLSTFSQC